MTPFSNISSRYIFFGTAGFQHKYKPSESVGFGVRSGLDLAEDFDQELQ